MVVHEPNSYYQVLLSVDAKAAAKIGDKHYRKLFKPTGADSALALENVVIDPINALLDGERHEIEDGVDNDEDGGEVAWGDGSISVEKKNETKVCFILLVLVSLVFFVWSCVQGPFFFCF